MPSISVTSTTDKVYCALRDDIINRKIEPGSKLNIDKISREYEVSLIPIREALARLRADNLVTQSPNRGYSVTSEPTLDELKNLFHARNIIEIGAVALISHPIEKSRIKKLGSINEKIGKIDSSSGNYYSLFTKYNNDFHNVLIGLSDNNYLIRIHGQLHYSTQISRALGGFGTDDLKEIYNEHDEIIKCLTKGDIDNSVKFLKKHLEQGARRIIETIENL